VARNFESRYLSISVLAVNSFSKFLGYNRNVQETFERAFISSLSDRRKLEPFAISAHTFCYKQLTVKFLHMEMTPESGLSCEALVVAP